MIYDSLRKLPMVICVDVIETGDVTLLYDGEIELQPPLDELFAIWEPMEQQYRKMFCNTEGDKVFILAKEIDFQQNRQLLIETCAEALKFDESQAIIEVLAENGYTVRPDHYHEDIEKALRESKGITVKIGQLKRNLPKESESTATASIVNLMASYATIYGDFDFYACSVEKFKAIEDAVKAKVAAMSSKKPTKHTKK